jgi:hypothetical protein
VNGADVVGAREVAAEQVQERPQAVAPRGANGTMIVSSETLSGLLPVRPALSTGGGSWEASDASLPRTFSRVVLLTSGASANSLRSSAIFSSTVRA